MHAVVEDNYAWDRFSPDGVDRSAFDAARHARYLDWFVNRYEDVYRTYLRLADPESRELYSTS
jgi:hypothetical protein